MKARTVSMAAILVLGLSCLSGAQEVGGTNQRLQRLMDRFHKADINNDGHLTRDEAQKAMPRVYAHFSEIDAGNQGFVTLDQITAWMEAHPAPRARSAPPPSSP